MANREIAQAKAQFATLKDLAPAEKAKIGTLMKKLTSTITLQKAVETDLISQLHGLQHTVKSLQRHNAKLTKSKQALTAKLANTEEKLTLVSHKLAQKLANAPVTLETAVQTQAVKGEMRTFGSQTEEYQKEPKANRAFQSIREEVTRLSETLQAITDSTTAQAHSGPIISKKADYISDLVGNSPEREERLRAVLARSAAYSRKSQLLLQSSKGLTDRELPSETAKKLDKYSGKRMRFTEEMESNDLSRSSFHASQAILSSK
jgi:membrane-bound lytic murein transglycosylase